MNLIDFFNPKNLEHVKAYYHLQHQGSWPSEFWEEIKEMKIPEDWNVLIMQKLSDCWVEFMLVKRS